MADKTDPERIKDTQRMVCASDRAYRRLLWCTFAVCVAMTTTGLLLLRGCR